MLFKKKIIKIILRLPNYNILRTQYNIPSLSFEKELFSTLFIS